MVTCDRVAIRRVISIMTQFVPESQGHKSTAGPSNGTVDSLCGHPVISSVEPADGGSRCRARTHRPADSAQCRSRIYHGRRLGNRDHAVWAMEYYSAMLAMSVLNIEMHLFSNGLHPGDPLRDGTRVTGGLTDRNGTPFGTWQYPTHGRTGWHSPATRRSGRSLTKLAARQGRGGGSPDQPGTILATKLQ